MPKEVKKEDDLIPEQSPEGILLEELAKRWPEIEKKLEEAREKAGEPADQPDNPPQKTPKE